MKIVVAKQHFPKMPVSMGVEKINKMALLGSCLIWAHVNSARTITAGFSVNSAVC